MRAALDREAPSTKVGRILLQRALARGRSGDSFVEDERGRPSALVQASASWIRHLGRQKDGLRLFDFVVRRWTLVRRDEVLWASVAGALSTLGWPTGLALWMRDWRHRRRTRASRQAILDLAVGEARRHNFAAARAVSEVALGEGVPAGFSDAHRVLVALHLAGDGDLAGARARMHGVDLDATGELYRDLGYLVRMLCDAEPAELPAAIYQFCPARMGFRQPLARRAQMAAMHRRGSGPVALWFASLSTVSWLKGWLVLAIVSLPLAALVSMNVFVAVASLDMLIALGGLAVVAALMTLREGPP
jgi:hypothetical protein